MTGNPREPAWRAQFWTMARSDWVIAYRTRALHLLVLVGASFALPFVLVFPVGFAGRIPDQVPFGFSDAEVTGMAAATMALLYVGSFGASRYASPTVRLLTTLPVDRRAVWATSVWRSWLAAGGLMAIAAVAVGFLAVNGITEVILHRAFLVGFAVMGSVAAGTAGQYTFIWLKTRPLALRRGVWAIASVWAISSPTVYAATGDPVLGGYAAGPWYAVAAGIEAASNLGLVGAFVAVVALCTAGFAALVAPIPAFGRAAGGGDAESGIVTSFGKVPAPTRTAPQPVRPVSADPDQRGTVQQQRAWENMRAQTYGRKTEGVFDALDVPEGRPQALRFYLSPKLTTTRDTLISLVGTLLLFAMILWGVTSFTFVPVDGPGAIDRQSLLVLGALLWSACAIAVAFAVFRRLPDPAPEDLGKEGDEKERKPGASAWILDRGRPRPRQAFFRSWRMLQTVPVDRWDVERALRPGYWVEVALAVTVPIAAAGVAAAIVGAAVPSALFAAALLVAVAAAALAMLGPIAVIDSAVRPDHSFVRRLWRWAIVALWFAGGLVAVVVALFAGSDILFGTGVRPSGVVALALIGAFALSFPWMVWRGRVEGHVETQKPFETTRRLVALTAAGLGMAAVGVLLLVLG
jgi:hypothetical protein